MELLQLDDIEADWRHQPPESIRYEIAKEAGLPADIANTDPDQIASFVEKKLGHSVATVRRTTPSRKENGFYNVLEDLHEIRLLNLHASTNGSFSAPLVCSLQHVSVEFEYSPQAHDDGTTFRKESTHAVNLATGEPVWYTALSYLWGPPLFTQPILIETSKDRQDRRRRYITPTLDIALRNLRKQGNGDAVTLWVDQLCIDQEDQEEKAIQVSLMALVYKRALNTVIWLGDESDNGAFDVLRAVHRGLSFTLEAAGSDLLDSVSLPCTKVEAWQKLNSLFSRPYFMRVWIMQEVILSRRACVVCGPEQIHWDEFSAFCLTAIDSGFYEWLASENGVKLSGAGQGCSVAKYLQTSGTQIYQGSELSLFLAMVDSRYAQATNTCDKVYGLLGLTAEKVKVDYSLRPEEVFWDATLTIIEKELRWFHDRPRDDIIMSTFLFTSVLCCVDHEPKPGTPSWVPDWSRPRATVSIGHGSSTAGIYKAGVDFAEEHKFTVGADRRSLEIVGKFVDVVNATSSVEDDLGDFAQANAPNKAVAVFSDFASRYDLQKIGDQDSFDALWTTLVAGKDASGSPESTDVSLGRLKCPSTYRKVFETNQSPARRVKAHEADPQGADEVAESDGKRKEKEKKKKRRPAAKPPRLRASQTILSGDAHTAFVNAVRGRRLCITEKRHLALVPAYTQQGDIVAVFAGMGVPFLLRPAGDEGYSLVGETYVHGIMEGGFNTATAPSQIIRII